MWRKKSENVCNFCRNPEKRQSATLTLEASQRKKRVSPLQKLHRVHAESLHDCRTLQLDGLTIEKGNTMKKIVSLLVAGALLVGTVGFAQEKAMARQSTGIQATFYDGIPSENGALVTNDFGQVIEANLVSSSIGKKIDGLADADYINLQVADQTLVFEIFGGDTTNEMTLDATTNSSSDSEGTTISLGQVTAALENAQNVAVFTDGDGVVQGFYTFTANNLPNINVEDAERLTLMSQNSVTTFTTIDPGAVKLDSVLVLQGEEYVPLKRTAVFAETAAL
jgi:hypothetical protein